MTKKEYLEHLNKVPPVKNVWKHIPLNRVVLAIKEPGLAGWTCPRCGWQINKIQHCLRCGQALAYGEFIGREPQYRTLEEEIEALDKINEGCVNSLTGGEKYMSLAKERELILLKYPYQEG